MSFVIGVGEVLFEINASHAHSTIPIIHRWMDISGIFHSTQFNVPIPLFNPKQHIMCSTTSCDQCDSCWMVETINAESTPADMDLEDNDQIDCFLAQVGGGERLF